MLFSYCIGSFLSPLILGFLMKHMGAHGFTLQYVVLAGMLLLFALTQAVIPRTKRGPYVSMPVNAGVGSVLLDQSLTQEEATDEDAQEIKDSAEHESHETAEQSEEDLQAVSEASSDVKMDVLGKEDMAIADNVDASVDEVSSLVQQDLAIKESPRPPAET